MPDDCVQFEEQGAIAFLRIHRPAVHNAVNEEVIEAFEHHLATLDQRPDLRVLLITGAGHKTFCAGSDLNYFTKIEQRSRALDMVHRMQAVLDRLERGPQVTIAVINGNTFGGGCELITACHLRYAHPAARFSFRQAAMGLVTGWGGGGRVFRLLGRANALRLLLTATTIDGREALRIGLVDRLCAADQLMDEALLTAREIIANAPTSIESFLQLANAVDRQDHQRLLETERQLFSQCLEKDDFWHKVDAWQERKNS